MGSGSVRFRELENALKIKILPFFRGLEGILTLKFWANIRAQIS